MLKIILNDGSEYENNPNLGWNLETKEEIQEVFDEVGFYELFVKEKGWERIYKRDLKAIV
ncbi:hypothetical protein U6X16_04530 [Bacillus velezensis]|uniref:hypothetical protein n=1 Tax=Bacillus velezensis TaxID=492670 RepID=UPI002ADE6457|nr:hypothetical protein [Bacillus velezensis]MEA1004965.1 hypothetical protein [Bacillus velezensis]